MFFMFSCFVSSHLWAQDARDLKVIHLKPPVPASDYKTPYVENTTGQQKRSAYVNMKHVSYQYYVPGGVERPERKRPMIVLLHGTARTGASLVDKWRIFADMDNLVLIGPTAAGQRWGSRDETARLYTIIQDAVNTFNIDTNRIYLFGHSDGATTALTYGLYFSELFAAVGIHAGQFSTDGQFQMLNNAKRKIPVVIINGTHDPIFKVDSVTATAHAFADHGYPTTLYILEGHNHWYYTISDYINAIAWNYMSKHSLDPN